MNEQVHMEITASPPLTVRYGCSDALKWKWNPNRKSLDSVPNSGRITCNWGWSSHLQKQLGFVGRNPGGEWKRTPLAGEKLWFNFLQMETDSKNKQWKTEGQMWLSPYLYVTNIATLWAQLLFKRNRTRASIKFSRLSNFSLVYSISNFDKPTA